MSDYNQIAKNLELHNVDSRADELATARAQKKHWTDVEKKLTDSFKSDYLEMGQSVFNGALIRVNVATVPETVKPDFEKVVSKLKPTPQLAQLLGVKGPKKIRKAFPRVTTNTLL